MRGGRGADRTVVPNLDDPGTFPGALAGVGRLFIMTGHTMNAVTRVKTMTDAAVDAGVRFIVRPGVLSDGGNSPVRATPGTS